MTTRIGVRRHAGWAEIRLDRAAKRNAIDRAMREQLLALVHELEPNCRAVVVTGTGAAFCAGLDLAEQASDREAGRDGASNGEWGAVLAAIRSSPAVFIAAVNGWALGGGASLVHVCDLAVAATTARIGYPEIRSGRYPTMAGPTARGLLGPKRWAWMVLSGESIDAATARDWGLVTETVAPERLAERAAAIATLLAAHSPVALAESKAAMAELGDGPARLADLLAGGVAVNRRIRARAEEVTE